jgi:hypothetical protein
MWTARILAVSIVLVGLVVSADVAGELEWPVVALLGGSAVFWLAEVIRLPSDPLPWGAASLSLVGAITNATAVSVNVEMAGVAAGVAGAVVAWFGLGVREENGVRAAWVVPGALTALVGVLAASEGDWSLAAALAAAALAWAGATAALRLPVLAGAASLLVLLATFATLTAASAAPWATVGACAVLGFGQLALSAYAEPRGGFVDQVAQAVAVGGLAAVLSPVVVGAVPTDLVSERWMRIDDAAMSVALAIEGGWLLTAASLRRLQPAWYIGYGGLVSAVLHLMYWSGVENSEPYTTVLGLYVIGMGYMYARLGRREVPTATDVAGTLICLGPPALFAVSEQAASTGTYHALWAIGLSLLFITAGVLLRVRAYFVGGVLAIAWVALLFSFRFFVEFWWLLLGFIGVLMLVVALTWERQRSLAMETRSRISETLSDWR